MATGAVLDKAGYERSGFGPFSKITLKDAELKGSM